VKAFCPIFVGLLLVCPSHAQRDIQSLTIARSATASDAVTPISVQVLFLEPPQGLKQGDVAGEGQVVGTGFFIDRTGDFITAGHVIDSLNPLKGNPKIANADLTARIRNREGGGSDRHLMITDRDYDHDLVLCHVPGVNAVTSAKSNLPKNIGPDYTLPFASLTISTVEPKTGQFVLVSGFPLGSWTSTVQFGMVAATKSRYPGGAKPLTIRKDSDDLLQISVNSNHGNSGGPVIDLKSGQVIGVLDAFVPAPLQFGQQIYTSNTFSASGIMFAVPAKWVEALLEKNHIKSEAVPAGKLVAQ
jgi:S1-C subfamily serine protease